MAIEVAQPINKPKIIPHTEPVDNKLLSLA